MKRYIKSHFSPHAAAMSMVGKTKYEVRWVSPDGNDCLLGGSKSVERANEIAREQAYQIFDNPWETTRRKLQFLESISVEDKNTGYNEMSVETDDYIEDLMQKLFKEL